MAEERSKIHIGKHVVRPSFRAYCIVILRIAPNSLGVLTNPKFTRLIQRVWM